MAKNIFTGFDAEIDELTGLPKQEPAFSLAQNLRAPEIISEFAPQQQQQPITSTAVTSREPIVNKQLAEQAIASPNTSPELKVALARRFDLGQYSDDNREQLAADSGPSWGDKGRAALATIGAGFMGQNAQAAGLAVLDRARQAQGDKLAAFDKGRAGKIEQYKLDKMATDDGLTSERVARESDPSSQESQLAQSLAKRMMPSQSFDGMSANQINGLLPNMSKVYDIEQRKLDRQESTSARMQDKSIARQDKMAQQAKLSDKQTSELATHDKAISAIDDIVEQKKKWDTGKLSMGMNKVAGMVGLDDAQKSAFKSDVGEQLASYIKAISGATVSPTERASLLENVPSVYDNDDTFNAKAQALRKRLERNRQIELEYLNKSGKDTEAFKSSKPVGGKVKVSDGKQTLIIDEADLADAVSDGFKQVP